MYFSYSSFIHINTCHAKRVRSNVIRRSNFEPPHSLLVGKFKNRFKLLKYAQNNVGEIKGKNNFVGLSLHWLPKRTPWLRPR